MNRSHRILRKLLWVALLVPFAELVYPGCALMLGDAGKSALVRSNPARARVFLDDRFVGETPVRLDPVSVAARHLRIELDGFEPAVIPLQHGMDPGEALGDLLLGGAPIVVDLLTGAIFTLDVPQKFKDRIPADSRGFDWASVYVMAELHSAKHGAKIAQMRRK